MKNWGLLIMVWMGISLSVQAQIACNPGGNLWVYSNYDGGVLNIDVDVNIPNIKIGVCTYEPVTINITGAFAGNVTEVRYAGYVSTTNFHCSNSPSTTTITGVPANITSVNFLPPATLSNPNGYSSIVCAYSCSTTSNQGGCNTVDQIKDYFQSTTGGTLISYYTQYGCWSVSPYALSAGGNCCNAVLPCAVTVDAGPSDTICPGGTTNLSASTTGGSTYSWSPAAGLSNPNIANPSASPSQTTTYVLTVTDGGPCAAVDSVVVVVATPQVTISPIPAVCADAAPFSLQGGIPSGGTWAGNHVNAGVFDPISAGPGTHAVTYSATDANGCNGMANGSVVVNPLPVVSLAPQPPFCLSDPGYLLSNGSPAGGSYAGPGIANGTFFPPLAGIGNHALMYTYSDSNGCSDTVSTIFSVYPNPSTAIISQSGIDSLYAVAPGDSFSWYFNGGFLLTNGPGILAQQSGTYTVVVWQNGCPSELSAGYVFEAVGVDAALSGLMIWPNPVNDVFFIDLAGEEATATFLDMTGRKVLPAVKFRGKTSIAMHDLPAGTYFLAVESAKGRGVWKVVKVE